MAFVGRISRAAALAAVIPLCACSLIGLGDLEPARCAADSDCAALDEILGLDECERHRCDAATSLCVREPVDRDGDGEPSLACDGLDCDDDDGAIGPHATEVCGNEVDEDCSGAANDLDCDGHDSLELGGGDCDDDDPAVGPHAAEVCNGVDDDCNGALDGPDEDDDGDLHADACAGAAAADCDDADPGTYYDAPELCDGWDNDCALDGLRRVSGGLQPEPAEDRDGDGHADPATACEATDAMPKDDCDDLSPDVHPGAFEACDGIDNDCDGVPDNAPGREDPGSACLPMDVSPGGDHTCALLRTGEAVCWGSNDQGQLGDEAAPEDAAIVVPGISDLVSIESGVGFSCGLHGSGEVSCWGEESIIHALPVYEIGPNGFGQVPGIEDATALAAGDYHACVIVGEGEVACWGFDCMSVIDGGPHDCGQSVHPRLVPGIDDAVALDAGGYVSCAVRETGGVTCWGSNYRGQLGDGTTGAAGRSEVAGIDDATGVACGRDFACALHEDGTVSCWGANDLGQLGCGGTAACGTESPLPVAVDGLSGAADLQIGVGDFACALLETGEVACWGAGAEGQLGVVDLSPSAVPVMVGGLADAGVIGVGATHACAILTDQAVCWGLGTSRQLGDGRTTYDPTPPFSNAWPAAVSMMANAMALDGGSDDTCLLMPDRTVRCFGFDTWGETGGGTSWPAIARDRFGFDDVRSVAVGSEHSCLARDTGGVHCYGDTRGGQTGTEAIQAFTDVVQVAAGDCHTCALHADGGVSCWGGASEGQLGAGILELVRCRCSSTCTAEAQEVVGLDDASAIVVGMRHSCALRRGGAVSCWGSNAHGEVGSRPFGPIYTPRDVVGLPDDDPAIAVAAGAWSTCALVESGHVYCWGAPLVRGAPMIGSQDPSQLVGVSDVAQIAMANATLCMRQRSGQVRCLGANEHGELGDGSTADSALPVNVRYLVDARDIGCGESHCCATRTSGQTLCWGSGDWGALGNPWAASAQRTPVTTVDLLRM